MTMELGRFRSTYNAETVRDLVVQGLRVENVRISDDPVPPVLRAHYLSENSTSRIVVTTGNRIESSHQLIIELTADESGTDGVITVTNQPVVWSQDAVNMVKGVDYILGLSSPSMLDIPSTYISKLVLGR